MPASGAIIGTPHLNELGLNSPKPLNNQQSFTSNANKQKSSSEVKPTSSRHFYVELKGADHVH
jgi:hypothetical protein